MLRRTTATPWRPRRRVYIHADEHEQHRGTFYCYYCGAFLDLGHFISEQHPISMRELFEYSQAVAVTALRNDWTYRPDGINELQEPWAAYQRMTRGPHSKYRYRPELPGAKSADES